MKLITKKFQLTTEEAALELVKELNKNNYKSINMGSGVVSRCRQTKKLEKILLNHELEEFIPSEYDEEKILEITK